MFDLRPNIAIRSGFFKFYKKKKSKEIVLSKRPIQMYNVNTGSNTSCREVLISDFYGDIYENLENKKVKTNPYIPVPLASTEIDGKIVPLETDIIFTTNSVSLDKRYTTKKSKKVLVDMLDTIVGITSVCIANGQDEKDRRKTIGKAGDCDFTTDTVGFGSGTVVNYKVLSPFWTVSPIMVSFIMGLVRGCFNVTLYYDGNNEGIINEILLDNVNMKDIHKIINTVDYEGAKEIYNNVLVPYFETEGVSCSKGMLLSYPSQRKALQYLIDNGCHSVFRPHRMIQHWRRFDNRYGFNRFCSYLNNPRSVLLYDNYKRV